MINLTRRVARTVAVLVTTVFVSLGLATAASAYTDYYSHTTSSQGWCTDWWKRDYNAWEESWWGGSKRDYYYQKRVYYIGCKSWDGNIQ